MGSKCAVPSLRVYPPGCQRSSGPRDPEIARGPLSLREPDIQRSKWQFQGFSDRNVPGVIAVDVVTQLPDPLCKRIKCEQLYVQLREVLECGVGFGRRHLLPAFQPA